MLILSSTGQDITTGNIDECSELSYCYFIVNKYQKSLGFYNQTVKSHVFNKQIIKNKMFSVVF